jgi:hypothetical protein
MGTRRGSRVSTAFRLSTFPGLSGTLWALREKGSEQGKPRWPGNPLWGNTDRISLAGRRMRKNAEPSLAAWASALYPRNL